MQNGEKRSTNQAEREELGTWFCVQEGILYRRDVGGCLKYRVSRIEVHDILQVFHDNVEGHVGV